MRGPSRNDVGLAREHSGVDEAIKALLVEVGRHGRDLISGPTFESAFEECLAHFLEVPLLQVVDDSHVVGLAAAEGLDLVAARVVVLVDATMTLDTSGSRPPWRFESHIGPFAVSPFIRLCLPRPPVYHLLVAN